MKDRMARLKRNGKTLGNGWAAKRVNKRKNRRGKRSKSTGYQL
jgi:hypothetical protein